MRRDAGNRGHQKRKVNAAKDSLELIKIVLEHRDQFSDARGQPLPFVRKLSAANAPKKPKTVDQLRETNVDDLSDAEAERLLRDTVDRWNAPAALKNAVKASYSASHFPLKKKLAKMLTPELKINKKTSAYNPLEEMVYLQPGDDEITAYHEFAHKLDNEYEEEPLSDDRKLTKARMLDIGNFIRSVSGEKDKDGNTITVDDDDVALLLSGNHTNEWVKNNPHYQAINEAVYQKLRAILPPDGDEDADGFYRALADMVSGATYTALETPYCHDREYWKAQGLTRNEEAFAGAVQSLLNDDERARFKETLPHVYQWIVSAIEKLEG
jgi:hypothetical protein